MSGTAWLVVWLMLAIAAVVALWRLLVWIVRREERLSAGHRDTDYGGLQ